MSEKHILVVDDSRLSRMMVKSIIAEHKPNWKVSEAASGDEALELFKDNQFDLAIIDFNMPGLDGLQLIEAIRKDHASIKLCMLTANIQDAIRQRAEALGASFTAKPITEDGITTILEGID